MREWNDIKKVEPEINKEYEWTDGEKTWLGVCSRYLKLDNGYVIDFVARNYNDRENKFKFWREIEKTTID